jgi:hypothetical protein
MCLKRVPRMRSGVERIKCKVVGDHEEAVSMD